MTDADDVHLIDARTPEERDRSFLPGMQVTWLLPLYDLVSRVARTHALHERTVQHALLAPGQDVLDVGCGTGNLTLAVLAAQPSARVTGLDPDPRALRQAARKARRRAVALTLVCGYADRLPAEDASLDRVVSALALHHLDAESRAGFAREALRALRPGGTVTIADLGGHNGDTGHGGHHGHGAGGRLRHTVRHVASLLCSRPTRRPQLAANVGDDLVRLFVDAGFGDVQEVGRIDHRYGPVSFVQATRP